MQLNVHREAFRRAGVAVAAVTFDGVDVLAEFTSDRDVEYPMLSDPSGAYMDSLGIRNEEYGPDHPAFGIAHPGVMWIDPSRTIRYKAAMADYRDRPRFAELLTAVSP